MKANKAMLASLGLSTGVLGGSNGSSVGASGATKTGTAKKKAKRKRAARSKTVAPTRRSRRLAHQPADDDEGGPQHIVWEWEGDENDWNPFAPEVAVLLQEAWDKLTGTAAAAATTPTPSGDKSSPADAKKDPPAPVPWDDSTCDGLQVPFSVGQSAYHVIFTLKQRQQPPKIEQVNLSTGYRRQVRRSMKTAATSQRPKKKQKKEIDANRLAKYERLMEKHVAAGRDKLPPSATYAHTVHRVLSMSEKRLATRVRVIERAQGKYAVLKMRMFAEVLILEGYTELAQQAEEALDRLLQLPKFSTTKAAQDKVFKMAVGKEK